MFYDESIPLPPHTPKILLEDDRVLKEYYDKGDWISFDMYVEGVETTIKSCHLTGKLTRSEALQIMRRYGI